MADKKISQLTAASTPLAGTEVLPIVQSSATVKASIANIQAAPVAAANANAVQYLDASKVPSTSTTFVYNGALGVGTSNPLSRVSIAGGNLSVTGDAEAKGVLKLGDDTTATPYVGVYRGALGSLSAGNYLNLGGFDGVAITAQTAALGSQARRLTILTSTGNVTVDTGNLVMGTAGKGIDFSVNANAAGMTSELLNDYEEGTWTPQLTNETPPTTPYTMQIYGAVYTKVGRLVTVHCRFRTTAVDTTGAAGDLRISGLPFTAAGGDLGFSAASISFASSWTDYPINGFVGQNSTVISLRFRSAVNGADQEMAPTSLASGTANNLILTLSYITA